MVFMWIWLCVHVLNVAYEVRRRKRNIIGFGYTCRCIYYTCMHVQKERSWHKLFMILENYVLILYVE